MILPILSLLGGLVFLTIGAEGLIRGSIAIGKHFKVSPLLMGLTLVAFGTSSPELMASLQAALSGSPGIALGNVVGSNIFNIAAILGIAALLAGTLPVPRDTWQRDGLFMLAATIALTLTLQFLPVVPRYIGLVFLLLLAGYIVVAYRAESASGSAAHIPDEVVSTPRLGMFIAVTLVVAGLVGLMLGANLLVNVATALARVWGVSETVIGLTVVACGTSLPELATSVVAALKKQTDIAVGNIVGSNIFNVLAILGITSLVTPVAVPAQLASDGWIMLAITILFLLFARVGFRITRWEGALFLTAMIIYLWHLLA